uniref:Innexin n=1 Tax=Parastrongyloides trichosuri TaxID=131310 RepID=A0A0N4ZCY0_PARTI
MLPLPDIIKDLTSLANDVIDDNFDRVSCAYSVWVLMFAVLAATTSVYDKPLQCYHKLDHPGNWVQGLDNICYANGTYAIPDFEKFFKAFSESATFDYQDNENTLKLIHEYNGFSINYYQWIPYALLFQSFCFFIPKICWNIIINSMSFDIRSMLKKVKEMNEIGAKITDVQGDGVIAHIYNFLEYSMDSTFFSKRKCRNSMLGVGQILVKFLYIINAYGQFYFINAFVGNGNHLWGLEYLRDIFLLYPNRPQKYFPYNAICNTGHFKQTYISNINIQCVLSMNMINSYIYLFLYFWLLFVFVLSLYSFMKALLYFFNPLVRRNKLIEWLKNNYSIKGLNKYNMVFTRDIIKHDGFILFFLMKHNSGKRVTFSILNKIWEASYEQFNNNDETIKRGSTIKKEAKIIKCKNTGKY